MALLPPAFANPNQPFYIDGQEVVRIRSGVLDIQSAANDGSFISLSPVIFTPGGLTIPKWNMIAFPDNSFALSRTETPNVPVRNSIFMQTFPSNAAGIDNTIVFNGDVLCQGGDLLAQGDIRADGRVSGGAGLRYEIVFADNLPPPFFFVAYEGITLYIEGGAADAFINITLPVEFFEAARTEYQGATIFRLVSNNVTTQTVRLLDPINGGILLTASTNVPSIIEAVRLVDTVVTYNFPISNFTRTPLVLNALAAEKSKPSVKKL